MVDAPETQDPQPGTGARRRLPFGVTTVLAAAVAFVPVLSFDAVESKLGEALGIDGGPAALVLVLVVFALSWVFAGLLLAACSPRPAREGLLAGVLVAVVVTLILVNIARQEGDLVIAGLFAPIFGGLALGLGALAGNLAQRWSGGAPKARRPSRGPAIACFAAGLVIILMSIAVMGPLGLDPRQPLGLAVWAFGGGLIAGGLWGLARSRPRPGEEPA